MEVNKMAKEVFEKELLLIKNNDLREFVEDCLDNAPKYFYHIPASSSGKYHPKQDLGEGGLVRHTKAVVRVALDLIRCEQFEDSKSKQDEIISACLLHDILKSGYEGSGKTVAEHPLLADDFIERIYMNKYRNMNIGMSVINIENYIRSHMGIWNKDLDGNEILPKPVYSLEKLVHLADYIASRKYIDMSLLEE